MERGVLPWANAGCPEDLGSVGGGQEKERGANFGSLTLPSALKWKITAKVERKQARGFAAQGKGS